MPERLFGFVHNAGQPIEVVREIRDDIRARVTTRLRNILS